MDDGQGLARLRAGGYVLRMDNFVMGCLCGAAVMYLLNLRSLARAIMRADAAELRCRNGGSHV
jgi:hypothetical protein